MSHDPNPGLWDTNRLQRSSLVSNKDRVFRHYHKRRLYRAAKLLELAKGAGDLELQAKAERQILQHYYAWNTGERGTTQYSLIGPRRTEVDRVLDSQGIRELTDEELAPGLADLVASLNAQPIPSMALSKEEANSPEFAVKVKARLAQQEAERKAIELGDEISKIVQFKLRT